MNTFLIAWIFCLGLVIGSFLNVVIYRLPRNKNFIIARSACTSCNSELKWYHNIPLFSYLFLRGKCGFCKDKISIRYPLVEFLNGIFYLYFFWQYSFSANFFIFAGLISILLIIFFIDVDFQIIPDVITLPCMLIGLGISFLPNGIGFVPSIIGLLVGGGSLYLIAILGDWLFKKDSMGGGDIKMAAMLGAFLGWQKVLFIFLSSAVIGLVVSIALMAVSSKIRKERVVPFGPFLASAAVLAIIYGEQLIDLYVTNFLQVQ